MQADTELRVAYTQFLDLGRRLSAGGHYAAGNHALMGALHCAEDARDAARLAEVAGLLRDAKGVVDAIRPPHRLSTQAAHTGRSIFEMGAIEADVALQRQKAKDRIAEFQARGGGLRPGPSNRG